MLCIWYQPRTKLENAFPSESQVQWSCQLLRDWQCNNLKVSIWGEMGIHASRRKQEATVNSSVSHNQTQRCTEDHVVEGLSQISDMKKISGSAKWTNNFIWDVMLHVPILHIQGKSTLWIMLYAWMTSLLPYEDVEKGKINDLDY